MAMGGRAFHIVQNIKNHFTLKMLTELFHPDIYQPDYARVSINIRLRNSINFLFSVEKHC